MLRLTVCIAALLPLVGCVDADVRLGRNALGQGRYAAAVAAFERARARNVEPERALRRDLASAHRAWAGEHVRAGRCSDAADRIAAAEALSAPLLVDHQQLFDCRSAKGMAQADELAGLRALYTMGDRRAKVLRRLFDAAIAADSLDEAYTYAPLLEARFSLTPADRRALLPGLLAAGRHAAARSQLERLLLRTPGTPIDRLKLAELREKTGDIPGARAMYADLIRRYPSNPVAFLRQADFLARTGDPEGAARARGRANQLRGVRTQDRQLRPLRKSRR